MKKHFVILGALATMFHDVKTGLTLRPGQVAEISDSVRLSRKVSAAINGGHLKVISDEEALDLKETGELSDVSKEVVEKTDGEQESKNLFTLFVETYDKFEDDDSVKKSFTLDQMNKMADYLKLENAPFKKKDDAYDALVESLPEE